MREGEAESVAGLDQELGAGGVGGVEPIHGVGDEDGERDAEGPVAFEGVETNPDDALAADFAGEQQRGLRGVGEGYRPTRASWP